MERSLEAKKRKYLCTDSINFARMTDSIWDSARIRRWFKHLFQAPKLPRVLECLRSRTATLWSNLDVRYCSKKNHKQKMQRLYWLLWNHDLKIRERKLYYSPWRHLAEIWDLANALHLPTEQSPDLAETDTCSWTPSSSSMWLQVSHLGTSPCIASGGQLLPASQVKSWWLASI